MEHTDQSLSTRDLASPHPTPEAGTGPQADVRSEPLAAERGSDMPPARDEASADRERPAESPTRPASEAPNMVPTGGRLAAERQAPVGSPDGDALTGGGEEAPEPPVADDIGRDLAGFGEGQRQTDTTASEQRTHSPAGAATQASYGSEPRPDDGAEGNGTLLATELSADLQARWETIQTQFVDEPRGAVQDADKLVATVMQELAEGFAQERERLEAQWDRGEDISTEDLRVALRRYRAFSRRLLSA